MIKRHLLPKILLDWTDRLDIFIKEHYNVSPKQKALELKMDTIPNKRIDQNIQDVLEHGAVAIQYQQMEKNMADKQHRKHKEKRKKKKPK